MGVPYKESLVTPYNPSVESFSQALARYYGKLYPAPDSKLGLLVDLAGPPPARLMDVTSGTGEYVAALDRRGYECLGLELDYQMCIQAREHHPELTHRLFQGDMLELMDELRGPARLAFCLGNRLAQLAGDAELANAISQLWDITRPAGKVVLQVINFDRVLAQVVEGYFALPTLEARAEDGSPVVLNQAYTQITPQQLTNSIRLNAKGLEWTDTRPLLVLTQGRLENALPSGIKLQWYGDYGLRAWDEAAPETIAVLG